MICPECKKAELEEEEFDCDIGECPECHSRFEVNPDMGGR